LAYLHPDFRGIGVFPEYGRKFDQWHNVFWWYRPPNLENENSRTS
jgi:L-amino acid N-acyltransferase YncA